MAASVIKTGRAIVVSEAARSGGFHAEVMAQLMERAILSLEAPVKRVTGFDTIPPLGKLEDYFQPDADLGGGRDHRDDGVLSMAYEFKFPDVGEGITEGELLSWKVKEGDIVAEDQTLAEVETDKAVVEMPSPWRAASPSCTSTRATPSRSVR